MPLSLLQIHRNLIPDFILALGFVVILLGVVLIVTLIISRRRQNQLYVQQQEMTEIFHQQLLQSQIEVQESTYRHIAKELHDNVGQLLSTTKMLMGVTELKLGSAPDTLHTASATLGKAIDELRMLSRSLDNEWLERFNFLENVQAEVQRINAGETVRASLQCSTNVTMPAEQQIILFRIVQEAMQNALRHAQPSCVGVTVSGNSQQLQVRVANNGQPLPINFSGMGTTNMRHRAGLFGGTVEWLPVQEGTIVTICLPLKASA